MNITSKTNNRIKVITSVFLSACLLVPATQASHRRNPPKDFNQIGFNQIGFNQSGFQDYAKVSHVEPIYETVSHRVPDEHCWTETRYRANDSQRSYTSPLIGGLLGGALGNEIGHSKRNKQVGTAVGALLGASIGHDVYNHKNQRRQPYQEKICEVQYRTQHEEKLVGYNVDYQYQGRRYETRLDHDPGKRLKVAVNVQPVH